MKAPEPQPAASAAQEVRRLAKHLLAPLQDYYDGIKCSMRPSEFADTIAQRPINLFDGGKVACGALIVCAVASALFDHDLGFLQIVKTPILNEILVIGWFAFAALVGALLLQPFLRLFGGQADLSQVFGASFFLAIIYAPLLAIASALLMIAYGIKPYMMDSPFQIGHSEKFLQMRLVWSLIQAVPGLHGLLILSKLHRLSPLRVLSASLVATTAIGLLGALFVVALLSLA